jgi:hypothetical protein
VTFSTDNGPSPEDSLALTITAPTNFMCPVKPVVSVRYRRHPAVSANPDHPTNVIPVANFTQTGVFQTLLPAHHLPADVGQLIPGNEAFVGPVESACFSYLPPNTCTTTPYFNAGLLRVCKTIHSEATPILYTQNKFVLHGLKEPARSLIAFVGTPSVN